MSRRSHPGADRAAQNQQTIKSLLKLECNKVCADCKRNKHPRWASWNLGVFICIRCSGIHRGMGTHISRVKSVDLDTWTDEQLQSVLRWGNARANRYWEAKLAPGHIPSEAKIENFIRTKYESKRWVMDGPMPDPATLDGDEEDDVPLAVVQEKAKLGRSASQKLPSPMTRQPQQQQHVDLFGNATISPPSRPSTTDVTGQRRLPSKAAPAPPKQTKPGDSLLGLDFFGNYTSSGSRSSTPGISSPTSSGPSRPDLKQSILSLYASVPKKPESPVDASHSRGSSFGGMQPVAAKPKSAFGDLNDAFASLNFSSTPASTVASQGHKSTNSAFANLGSFTSSRTNNAPAPTLSGTGFFDTAPKTTAQPRHTSTQSSSISGNNSMAFGDFQSPIPASKPAPIRSAATNGLFDLAIPAPTPAPAPVATAAAAQPTLTSNTDSVFNLTATAAAAAKPQARPALQPTSSILSGWSNVDAWGSNEAWGTTEPAASKPSATVPPVPASTMSTSFGGWGEPVSKAPPQVTADEDFGGWASATEPSGRTTTTTTTTNSAGTKPIGGFGATEDLFSNVWQ